MENAVIGDNLQFSVYGSTQRKHVYIYGALNSIPTELTRSCGMTWTVAGWLLTPYLKAAGHEAVACARRFVADHIKDIFVSNYTARITLHEALQPEIIAQYNKRMTAAKYLITPNK
jgi:hypothetical protein